MAFVSPLCRSVAFAVLLASTLTAGAQQILGGPVASAATPAASGPTIAANPDLRPTTRLAGHLPPWAQASRDAGPVPDTSTLHLDLLLKRPAAQQAAFDAVLAAQQDPHSPLFHAWLTPTQIGLLYGPAQSDLDTLTAWLTAQGLQRRLTKAVIFARVLLSSPE